jgi:hypothetical protein
MKKAPMIPHNSLKLIVEIATGEVEDRAPTPEEQGKDLAAAALGRKAGVARASHDQRTSRRDCEEHRPQTLDMVIRLTQRHYSPLCTRATSPPKARLEPHNSGRARLIS